MPPAEAQAHADTVLWSDPEDEPPEELRNTQAMLRRLGILLALAMLLVMLAIGLR